MAESSSFLLRSQFYHLGKEMELLIHLDQDFSITALLAFWRRYVFVKEAVLHSV